MTKKIILSGIRPSGKLHLGNYWGALSRWLELQNNSAYQCYFMVADLHALTTGYDRTADLRSNTEEMVLDWLAAGLDPAKSVLFRQSDVAEHAELSLLLSMITPLGWLERIPTYKEQLRELAEREITTHGFLGYPVLQAADILVYKADAVPVGEDQLSHLELCQEVARRFNRLYGPVFSEPKALLGETPKVPGLDARKMSKSYGNSVELSDSPEILQKKVSQMYTDPKKIRANDHGHPEGCVVFALHKIYNPEYVAREAECREGRIGCVACKKHLLSLMDPALRPFRERRAALEGDRGAVWKVLEEGNAKARQAARRTLDEVKRAMGLA
ncbi:MAG TPA: tryptophan--tRNA ligase [Elusimicrobiota bacterium]|nr:tryptophan--tRNA ligase [Elusimicrobiota bacterium]